MAGNVVDLGPHCRMTVDETLDLCKRDNMTDVIVVGYDADDEVVIRSSKMSRADAVYLLEQAKLHALGR